MQIKNLLAVSLIILSSCNLLPDHYPESGVSKRLSKHRSERISDLQYVLDINVPSDKNEKIQASSQISFKLNATNEDIFLDYKASNDQLLEIIINTDTIAPQIVNEHIKLPSSSLSESNSVKVKFIMGDGALNRNDNYFYALFVPDRARTAIPCFDQPDIKGNFSVNMTIPENWEGIANGPQIITQALENKKIIEFGASKPISTYLWAFAAGEFKRITKTWKGKKIGLYHMVNDSLKLDRNVNTIFDQTIKSLNWLENYCDYDYPFETYNLLAIPSFQFGGMEHPGATYYRSELIFLDDKPTQNEKLRRANLIAHETAHMWFGDLVTMPWFNEVWLKEVFANFMADKITQPWFPEINHQLRFLLAHFPSAYSVDRTEGANPINQKLNNLKNAGTLYGSIIYHKSPIVMAQLEDMAGPDIVQLGIQEYIHNYAYSNATWNDLINCIDKHTENDLKVWSNAWVNEPGRPSIKSVADENNPTNWKLVQSEEHNGRASENTYWPQEINLSIDSSIFKYDFFDALIPTDSKPSSTNSLFFSDAKGYGLFIMNDEQLEYWMNSSHKIDDPLLRGRACINLFENFLDGSIPPSRYINHLLKSIKNENEAILINQYCTQLKSVFWNFISEDQWKPLSLKIEQNLMAKLDSSEDPAIRKTLYRCWLNIALSDNALDSMGKLCTSAINPISISLSDKDKIDLIAQLAIKQHPNWKSLYNEVHSDLKNPELRAMLEFVLPSLSDNAQERDAFWTSLSDVRNRQKEKWVELSLSYLHHPLRSQQSVSYLNSTIYLLEEIQKTGDIFFPIGWLKNSLNQHSSPIALNIVNDFLIQNPEYPEHLKLKILQNSDNLKRSLSIKERYLNSTE